MTASIACRAATCASNEARSASSKHFCDSDPGSWHLAPQEALAAALATPCSAASAREECRRAIDLLTAALGRASAVGADSAADGALARERRRALEALLDARERLAAAAAMGGIASGTAALGCQPLPFLRTLAAEMRAVLDGSGGGGGARAEMRP
eukprot:2607139-Prymnesium_polylepis.1